MGDRSAGHDPRSSSRCPGDPRSRSHLDSPGARSIGVTLRSAARASDGRSAGRASLLTWRESREPSSIRTRERARFEPKRGRRVVTRGFTRPPRGSGRERGTNRVHVFENRKKVGCKRPRPTRLVMHRGEGSVSRRRRLSGLPRRGTESEGLADRTSNRGAVGPGSSPFMDRHSHEWPRGWSNRTRRNASGGNEGSPAARRGHIVTVSILPPCLR